LADHVEVNIYTRNLQGMRKIDVSCIKTMLILKEIVSEKQYIFLLYNEQVFIIIIIIIYLLQLGLHLVPVVLP
jgi:hypothetical protein